MDRVTTEPRRENPSLTSTFEVALQRCGQFQVSTQKCPPARPHARLAAVFQVLLPAGSTNARMWPE